MYIKICMVFLAVFIPFLCTADDVFIIGAAGNTSNSIAKSCLNMAELIASEYSDTINGRYVETAVFDDTSADFKKDMKNTKNLIAVIGCFDERHSEAVEAMEKTSFISVCSQYEAFNEYDNAYRICASESQLAAALARTDIAVFGRRNFGVIYVEGNEDYKSMADAYTETVRENGAVISQFRGVSPERTDFKNILIYLRDKRVRVIYFAGGSRQAGMIARQANELNVGAVFTGTSDIFTRKFIKSAKSGGEGAEFTTKLSPESVWQMKSFAPVMRKYSKRYTEVNKYLPYIYEAALTAGEICEYISDGGGDVKEYLKNMKQKGITGDIIFNDRGERLDPAFYLYIIRRSTFWHYPIKGETLEKYKKAK
ncbi:MAG: ABC transporter substrate-binding protein [Candidatus Goldiibacteriota bacterium]